jgi:S-formylglutathione hydrolase FrmB
MSAWLDNDDSLINGGGEENKFYHVCKAVHDRSALAFMENADETAIAGLRTVKWFIDCGDDDFLFDLSVRLHQLMRDRGVKSELRVRNGVHNWEYWHDALRMALPYASRNFSK